MHVTAKPKSPGFPVTGFGMKKGFLVILSSPSGGGKTTILRELLKKNNLNYKYSISVTTRKPRNGEIDGIDYFFVSEKEFIKKIENDELIEWEQVHQHYYLEIQV